MYAPHTLPKALLPFAPQMRTGERPLGYGSIKYRVRTKSLDDDGGGFYYLTDQTLWLCSSVIQIGVLHERTETVRCISKIVRQVVEVQNDSGGVYSLQGGRLGLRGLLSFYRERDLLER